MEAESTQFTLEGNEVAHIANMDTNAAAEAHRAAAAAAATVAQASSDAQQAEVVHGEEHHQQQPAPMEIDVEAPHIDHALTVPTLPPIDPAPEEQEIVHVEHPTWHSFFFQLQGHQATYGTLDVDPEINPHLFAWVDEQRKLHKLWKNGKEALSQERILLLDALCFDWEGSQEPNYGAQAEAAAAAANSKVSGSAQDVESFHLRLAQLQQYKADNGHPNVPETYKKDIALGRWVAQQRSSYRKKTLPQDRIDAMIDIGFDFTPGDKKTPFETRLEQLAAYKTVHGDVRVPRRYAENPGLGEWLHCQKKLYRRWENDQKPNLNESRRKALLQIGVDFSAETTKNELDTNVAAAQNKSNGTGSHEPEEETANRSTKWDEKFHELRQYKLANGHTNVPRRSKRNPVHDALGEWVHFQRRQYRNLLNGHNSTMTIARKKALELLDFQWSRSGGSSMHHHHHHHHHGSHQDGQNQLTVREAVQAQILKAHEEGKSAPWDDRFAQLTEYVQRFGNADVPINYAENLSLGSWVFRQRIAYKVWNDEESQKLKEESNMAKETEEKSNDNEEESFKNSMADTTGNGTVDATEGEAKGEDSEGEPRLPDADNPVHGSEIQMQESNDKDNIQGANIQMEATNPEGQSEGPHDAAPQVSNSRIETADAEIPVPDTTVEIEEPQIGTETTSVGNNALEERPFVSEVDKMTQERYDKLVAVGFDFEIQKIPDDFVTADGQEPATLIFSKTAEEEEKPMVEDEQDVLEINLGEEQMLPEANSTPTKQEMEINEMEVSAILEGSGVNPEVPSLGGTESISVVAQTADDLNRNQDVDVGIMVNDTEKSDTADISEEKLVEDTNQVASDNKMTEANSSPNQDQSTLHSNPVQKIDEVQKTECTASITSLKSGEINPDPEGKTETHLSLSTQNMDDKNLVAMQDMNNNDNVPIPIEDQSNRSREDNAVTNEPEAIIREQDNQNGESNDLNASRSVNKRQAPDEEVVEKDTVNLDMNDVHMKGQAYLRESPSSKRRKLSTTVKVEWEERVLELVQYKIRKHNCNVPIKWKPNSGLADWVWRQRDQYRLYRLGQPSTLTTTRIAKLTELGFEFVLQDHHGQAVYHNSASKQHTGNTEKVKVRKPRPTIVAKQNAPNKPTPKSRFKEGKWLESLAKVVAYKEEFGSCNVPRKWKRDPTLGEWVHFQRRQFRLKQLGRRNHMTEDRIAKLEAIGFEWSRSTQSSQNYIRLYTDRKEIYEDQKDETSASAVVMPTAEHMMELTPMEMMDCREQAQQIADVVEQHVQATDQRVHANDQHIRTEQHVHVDHHVLGNVESKVEHIHEGLETKNVHIPGENSSIHHIGTQDMEPLPVSELNSNGEEVRDDNILSV